MKDILRKIVGFHSGFDIGHCAPLSCNSLRKYNEHNTNSLINIFSYSNLESLVCGVKGNKLKLI